MPGYIGLNRSMRSSGGGSLRDYTALTPANVDVVLTALGLTQAGTGTTWGETGQAATPLYAVAAAKVPLAVETIAGKTYFGPIVNPAGTNLALYSSDATNAAWVKTNCTASLQTGSLSDAAAANGHTLITATGNNATCLQSITSTSGERVTKWWVSTDDEGVFVSHGAPTGSALYEDAFGSDTSGEWSGGNGFVDGTITVAGGKLVYTKGAGDTAFARIARPVTGLNPSAIYRLSFVRDGGTTPNLQTRISSDSAGLNAIHLSGSSGVSTATGDIYFSGYSTVYIVLVAGAVTSFSLDSASIYQIAETKLVSGTTPYEDGFSSDTSGEWSGGNGFVDGTITVAGGKLVYTKGAGDASFARIVRQVTGLNSSARYKFSFVRDGATSNNLQTRISSDSAGLNAIHIGGSTGVSTATGDIYFTGYSTVYVVLIAGSVASFSLDSALMQIDEDLGIIPVPVDLAAYTGANPVIGIRIATSGDSVRFYGVQHQVADRPLRPRIGPTAGSSVTTGARSLTDTLSVAPTEIDIEFVAKVPTVNGTGYFQIGDGGNNRLLEIRRNSGDVRLLGTSGGVISFNIALGSFTGGEIIKVRALLSASLASLSLNDGTPSTAVPSQALPSQTALVIGAITSSVNQCGEPILAFRDNLGNLLAAPYGWNTRLLDNWS